MTILRILAFLPERPLFQKKSIETNFRDRAISGERDNDMVKARHRMGKRISVDLSSSLGKLFRKVDTTNGPFCEKIRGKWLVKQFLSQSELVSINYAKPFLYAL